MTLNVPAQVVKSTKAQFIDGVTFDYECGTVRII